MDKYTILLVDDEEEVVQAIMKRLTGESLGFSVIGYACNGVKAFEMVEEYQPDVIMTDIRMPYMDGLELSNRIKQSIRRQRFFFSPDLMNLNTQKKPCILKWRNMC